MSICFELPPIDCQYIQICVRLLSACDYLQFDVMMTTISFNDLSTDWKHIHLPPGTAGQLAVLELIFLRLFLSGRKSRWLSDDDDDYGHIKYV